MSTFSASDAALEGFGVLRRHWRVIAGWAGFNLLAMISMVVVTVLVTIVSAALVGDGSDLSQISSGLGGVVAFVGAFLIGAVMMGGLYRLMMRPAQPAFLHLRLGRDELRLVVLVILLMVTVGGFVGLAGLISATLPSAPPMLTLAVAIVGVLAAIWLMLRLSLTAPATFAEGRLAFDTSWRLTRGHVPALFGMLLLTSCVVALIYTVSSLAMLLVLGLTTGFGGLVDALSGRDESTLGLYVLQAVAQLLFAPVIWVIWGTPAVAAYRALAAPAEP